MAHEQVVGAELNMRHLTEGTKCLPIGNGKDGRKRSSDRRVDGYRDGDLDRNVKRAGADQCYSVALSSALAGALGRA